MLSNDQAGVLTRMLSALAITFVALTVSILWPPVIPLPTDGGGVALEAALQWDALLAFTLLVPIMRLARHRFFTPEDIAGGGTSEGTPLALRLQAILQNTLEQVALAVIVHSIWAVTMPLDWQAAVPAAVALFVVGRVLFAVGYAGGAPSRALGFALTFYPTAVMVFLLLLRLAADIMSATT